MRTHWHLNEASREDFTAKGHAAVAMPEAAGADGAQPRSVIDARLRITGDLVSEGEVQLEGEIIGDVRCRCLTVGKDARITGSITAQELIVRGKVAGTIRADRVIVQHSGRIDCEIFYRLLSLEEGAIFDGHAHVRPNPMISDAIDVPAVRAERAVAA